MEILIFLAEILDKEIARADEPVHGLLVEGKLEKKRFWILERKLGTILFSAEHG